MNLGGPRLDLSMRVQVLGPLVLGLAALALVVLVGLPWRLQAVARDWSERRVTSIAVFAAEAVKSGLDFGDAEFAAARLALLGASPDARYAVVLQSDGSPLASWGTVPSELPTTSGVSGPTTSEYGGLLVVEVPLVARGGTRGRLVAGFGVEELDRAWKRDGAAALVIAGCLWVGGLAFAWGYGTWLVRPLTLLTDAATRSDTESLTAEAARLLPSRTYENDERMILTQAFATMARRLASQVADLDEERRRALVAEESALRASATKSQFLANMSHELRTPLNAIIGYSEMVIEMEELSDDARDDIQRVLRAAKHLLALINDVLDLAKIEAERMELVPERFRVRRMVDDTVASARALVEQRRNELVVDIAEDVGEMESDLHRIRQCLFNLLSNAAKFTEQGTIRLGVARIDDHLTFAVSDTGMGMGPDQVSRLFQPFTQLDTSSTRIHGGTGLGLALTRRLCRALGGEVTVRSERGVGSTFTIYLPDQLPVRIQLPISEEGRSAEVVPLTAHSRSDRGRSPGLLHFPRASGAPRQR